MAEGVWGRMRGTFVILSVLIGLPELSAAAEIVPQLGHGSTVTSIAPSPDGRFLLSGGADNTARLWDLVNSIELYKVHGGGRKITSVAFTPDGKFFATAGDEPTVRLWEVATGTEIQKFEGHKGEVKSLAISPDGNTLATGSTDKTARLWDVATGKEVRKFVGHEGFISSIAMSPNGELLLTGDMDNSARLWDVASGREVHHFTLNLRKIGGINGVAFAPSGKTILTGSADGFARLWNVETGKLVREIEHSSPISSVAYSTSDAGIFLGRYDGSVSQWITTFTNELRRFGGQNNEIKSAAFSPDGEFLVTSGTRNVARLWEVKSGKEVHSFKGHRGNILSVAFSPDGRFILTGSSDETARLWDVPTGEETRRFSGPSGRILSVAFSPDGKSLVTGNNYRTVCLWDIATGQEIHCFDGHEGAIHSVAFSPDGKILLTGSEDNTTRLWDPLTGKELRKIKGRWIYTASFSPDGRLFFSDTDEGPALFETATGTELKRLPLKEAGLINSVAFSSDGKLISIGGTGRTPLLWNLATDKEERRFSANGNTINSVAFSPDDKTIASGGDGATQLWDISTGRELVRLISFNDDAWLAIRPDGSYTGSEDGAKHMAIVDGLKGRRMTDQEYRDLQDPDPDMVAHVVMSHPAPTASAAASPAPQPEPEPESKQVPAHVTIPPLSIETADLVGASGDAVTLKGRVINTRAGTTLSSDGISYPIRGDGQFEAPVSLADKTERIVELVATDETGARAATMVTIKRKLALAPQPGPIAPAGRRMALLMGNSTYEQEGWGQLPTVDNDLAAMEKVLIGLGFEVTIISNLSDRTAMKAAVVAFKEQVLKAGSTATVLFYFSGHGVSLNNAGYLVPGNAQDPASVAYDMIPDIFLAVNDVLDLLQDPAPDGRTTLLLLDACRSSSYAATANRRFGKDYPMYAGRTALFFAAEPGTTAAAGLTFSPFTAALVEELAKDGISASELHSNVERSVVRSTGGQRPSWSGSALPDLVFQRIGSRSNP